MLAKMEERTKYNVDRKTNERTFDGIVFDSALEMKYYRDVILPSVESGEILHYEMQKKYTLQPTFNREGKKIQPIEYKADFYTVDKDGKETVIDIKGCPDNVAKLKRKMFWYTYPNLDYVWLGFSKIDGGWTTYEAITSGRKQRKKEKTQKSKENKEYNDKK